MDIRGIFFDLYGTLLVYGDMAAAWSAWLEALHSRLAETGFTIDRSDLVGRCDGLFSRPEPVGGSAGLTLYERRLEALALELGARATAEDSRLMATDTASQWQRYISVDPNAVQVLETLNAELPVALISNFDHPPFVYDVLARQGLLELFDTVVVSGEVGIKKPNPAIFTIALERLGLEPEYVAYVGDAPEDVEGAVAAHLVPILIDRRTGDSWAEAADYGAASGTTRERMAQPAVTVSSLAEVVEIVLG
jgi:HAD superfamily hydrolase (TIGR01549 family)